VDKIVAENQATINMNAGLLEQTLAEFGVPAKVIGYRVGPTVTQYAVEPGYLEKAGDEKHKVRISQISTLSRDLALALKAERLRIEAPVPGESYVGVEVPNAETSTVRLRALLESAEFLRMKAPLALPLGRDVSGQPVVSDLSSMPHLLIAGTTNSGKSVCIQAITVSLAMNNHPDDLKLVMIDPKRVELNRFNGLPHLFGQVETNTDRIMGVLRWATTEMDVRYQKLEKVQARNLDSYNNRMRKSGKETMPRIVILIDELADLMISARDETETALVRLAQKARAVGMHLVVATQRPSADVITGLIKANFPTRIAFTVASSVDSRVILDANGAETLLGKGDMLFLHPRTGIPQRAQGVMVSDKEIQNVLDWWAKNVKTDKIALPIQLDESENINKTEKAPVEDTAEEEAPWEAIVQEDSEKDSDEAIINEAITLVRKQNRASASFLQRQLRIGYPKAAWLIDQLEARGVIGEAQSGGREREILPEEGEDAA
jgi:S-DNA-T family DNA segregation ATPase FtsK/SpoIIIE